MKYSPYLFLFLIFEAAFIFPAQAQFFPKKNYPQNYFQWPVGAQVGLVANFGELRPNHYHMGLDCRTDQRENRPVLAAADGYVAKIKIEPFGFGRCLYINHPNGLTTLYAHLNDFNPAIEQYITEQQYRLQHWEVFIDVPENLLPVKKGEEIALSGNTGGSQGPHVHFEIRDTKTDKALNPLLFGFPITDNIAPDVLRVAVYDRNRSTYAQTPKIYALKKVNGIYTPAGGKIIVASGKVSFAITAWDRYTGSTNQNGIYKAILLDDERPVCGFEMDSIGYDETRYLNAHTDYKTRSSGGPWLQHLSRLPGYPQGIYKTDADNGILQLNDTVEHKMRIEVSDANGNTSQVQFSLSSTGSGLSANTSVATGLKKFYPGFLNVFESDALVFYLPENAVYDSFYFRYNVIASATAQPVYQLHNATIPLHTYFPVTIKAAFSIQDTGKVIMKRSYGGKQDFKKAVYVNGSYKASFREFGNYQLFVDRTPPVIISRGLTEGMNAAKLTRMLFTVTDNAEDLSSFTAMLDGAWLRFSNDKASNFIYKFDAHCGPGAHELKIIATDLAGNSAEKIFHFNR